KISALALTDRDGTRRIDRPGDIATASRRRSAMNFADGSVSRSRRREERNMTRHMPSGSGVLVAVLSAVMLLLIGCNREGPPDADVAERSSALSTTSAAAFGFESLASWIISSGSASLGTPRTQGQS